MANTYVAIATVTVGSGGSSTIEFTSIPATYSDLVIKLSSRISTAAGREGIKLTFNSNTSSYSYRRLYGYDSNQTGSDNASSQAFILIGNTTADGATASTFGNHEIYIPNYTSSNNKSTSADAVAENNDASNWQVTLGAGLWANSAAITSITLTANANNFMQYSTATLYGIKNS